MAALSPCGQHMIRGPDDPMHTTCCAYVQSRRQCTLLDMIRRLRQRLCCYPFLLLTHATLRAQKPGVRQQLKRTKTAPAAYDEFELDK